MAILLGLAVALSYGAADFFGGLATKRASLASVIVVSQVLGIPVLLLLLPFAGGHPTLRGIGLGAIGGIAGGFGLACLYRGLARGRMSVVAPITAVGAAILPVIYGLATGERPTVIALGGVVLALLAVVLVSRVEGDEPAAAGGRSSLLLAALGGIGFGVVFICLARTGSNVGLWPLVGTRAASVGVLATGALVTRRPLRPPRPVMPTVVAAGALDMSANVLYVLAAKQGLLSLVAVLSSLYPASTVVLARVVLKERIGRLQLGGLALAGAGVVLIATG
jgi:drug/metabolite transporter (DMT)-like permease